MIVWQSYTLMLLFKNEVSHSIQMIEKETPNIEKLLIAGDFVKLKTILWNIKKDKITINNEILNPKRTVFG